MFFYSFFCVILNRYIHKVFKIFKIDFEPVIVQSLDLLPGKKSINLYLSTFFKNVDRYVLFYRQE